MKPDAQISANARPLRVAYVIEDGDGVHPLLDRIFSECFGRHGGRQSLVVPVIGGAIPDSFLLWLKAFDPDFVFIATTDNERSAVLVEEYSCPAIIQGVVRHVAENERSHRPFALRSQALTSLSWLPFLRIASGGFRARPEVILDCYPKWIDDGFITDNFGTLCDSFNRFPVHRELSEIVRPLMLTPADAPGDRWRFNIQGDEATNGYEALRFFTRSGNAISLAYLSNLYSKHISVRNHDWNHTFCLVLGDSYTDRVSCWNSGLLFDDAQHQSYKTLRVPTAAIDDDEKILQIRNFLNSNNSITRYGSQPRVTVRSSSLDEARLKEFAHRIGGKGSWNSFDSQRIESIEQCCPVSSTPRNNNWMTVRHTKMGSKVPLRHVTESAPVPRPFQLKQAPIAHPVCSEGSWIAEYALDRTNDNNCFANVRDTWTLPKRQQLVRLFVDGSETRITSGGDLAVLVDETIEQIEIREPNDGDFFHCLLHQFPSFPYPDFRHDRIPKLPYCDSRPSDKGRYLQGLLGIFGSLDRAYKVLTHGFWGQQLLRLTGVSDGQLPRLVRTIKKRFPPQAGQFVFDNDQKWEKLATTCVSLAPTLRQPRHAVKLSFLIDEWKAHLSNTINANTQLHAHRDEMIADAPKELSASLARLCSEGVFHQGYEWVCRRCAYTNWTAVDELRMSLKCQVCRLDIPIPVDMAFDFRINDYLANCLREHDSLSVIWALGTLQRRERSSSFIFSPQRDLFREYPDSKSAAADKEIDVLCVINGEVLVGEVKKTLSEIDDSELDRLIAIAGELRPEIVMIGALKGDESDLQKKLQYLRKNLAQGMKINGFLANDQRDGSEHYLP